MALTLNPGNEPEFYIPHEQLPDTRLEDIKLSPDSEYLAITGSNSLTYIYRRKADGSGFYKLDWACRHQRLAKSVVNFIGFGEYDITNKFIIFPGEDNMIYQYELNADDTVMFCNAYDISYMKYECIHWMFIYINDNANAESANNTLSIFISGSRPINALDFDPVSELKNESQSLSPMAEFYSIINFKIFDEKQLFKNMETYNIGNTPKIYSKSIEKFGRLLLITKHIYNNQYYEPYVECYHFISNVNDRRSIFQTINTPTCVFYKYKDNDLPYNILYNDTLIQYGYHIQDFIAEHQINEIKAIGDRFIIHSTFIPPLDPVTKCLDSDCLFMGVIKENTLTYELIKKYKFSATVLQVQKLMKIMFIKLFTLNTKYIAVHEKVKATNKLQVGFILNVYGDKKQKLKHERLNTVLATYLPPELIDIIQTYL